MRRILVDHARAQRAKEARGGSDHRTLLPRHLSFPSGRESVTHVFGTMCYLCLRPLSEEFQFVSRGPARAGRARPLLVNTRDLCIYQTNPGLSAPPLVGLRSKVIEMNAPTHDPEAAKPTYIQFFV